MTVTLSLALLAGFVSFISPCVLPLVPAYIGYMSGRVTQTVSGQLQVNRDGTAAIVRPSLWVRFNTLVHGIAFVLGFTIVFVTFGLLITALTGLVNVNVLSGVIGRIGGTVIIFFGLHFMGIMPSSFKRIRTFSAVQTTMLVFGLAVLGVIVFVWGFTGQLDVWNSSLWEREPWAPALGVIFAALWVLWMFLSSAFTQPQPFTLNLVNHLDTMFYADTRREMTANANNGLIGSVLMGMVFSAGWTPCIGPVYGTILTVAAQTGDVGYAIPMLVAYSLGLGIPFLLFALLLDGGQVILRRLQRHMRTIKMVSGAFLVFIGILVATGQIQNFSRDLGARFTELSVRVEECVIGAAQGTLPWGELGECLNTEVEL